MNKTYIDGKWIDGTSQNVLQSINPATGEVIARIKENSVDNLSKIWFDKQKNFIGGLHPVSIDAAKKIIVPNYSHCGRITDIEYYGN